MQLDTLPNPIPELERDFIRYHLIPNLNGIICAMLCSVSSRDPYRAIGDVDALEREVARIRFIIEHGAQEYKKAAATNSDPKRREKPQC